MAKEMNLHIVEWINSVNENSIIQRPSIPGKNSWRPSSIDDGNVKRVRQHPSSWARSRREKVRETKY